MQQFALDFEIRSFHRYDMLSSCQQEYVSMTKVQSKLTAACAIASGLLFGHVPLAVSADGASGESVTPQEEFSAMQHEVNLESGEKLLLAHRHKVASYRVCVDSFQGSVPLKVFVDGTQSVVGVAACETVTGKHIDIEPGAKLPSGEYLVARFRQIKI